MNDAGENVSVVTPERLFGALHVPAEQYPWYIDLLRNERPVRARVFDESALNDLTTLNEPVGDGEPTP